MLLKFLAAAVLGTAAFATAQQPIATPAERRTSAAYEAARTAGLLDLHAFLVRMPKGADLHNHLDGAVYAETFLRDAAKDGLCLDPVKLAFLRGTSAKACPAGAVPAATAFTDQRLYDALVDAFSMRAFVPSAGLSGHDQFFSTFSRFGGTDRSHKPEYLDEVATRAAAQNEQYVEVMYTPPFDNAIRLSKQYGWPAIAPVSLSQSGPDFGDSAGASRAELAALRDKLLANGLRDDIATDRAFFDQDLAARKQLERCDTPAAAPACSVDIRILYQVLRGNPPAQVFAQTLLAFEVAQADPQNVVGLNFVMAEDGYLSMSEYHRQMLMLDYLHSVYPTVRISLHAGELAPGFVPPAGLQFHIRQAVDLGHATRIGHGVDVMFEQDPQLLLRELHDRHIMVEINLTSNDVILGVTANRHSLPAYRAAHVPVALSTDDEGVSRIDLTHEFVRAATDFHLSYLDLKQMVRTSLEHTFLPGLDLWAHPDDFTHAAPPCATGPLGAATPSNTCLEFLRGSPHATQQWELEHRFLLFESTPVQ